MLNKFLIDVLLRCEMTSTQRRVGLEIEPNVAFKKSYVWNEINALVTDKQEAGKMKQKRLILGQRMMRVEMSDCWLKAVPVQRRRMNINERVPCMVRNRDPINNKSLSLAWNYLPNQGRITRNSFRGCFLPSLSFLSLSFPFLPFPLFSSLKWPLKFN